ncbi:bifunctional orotidine-5'-phosphate decarboxylase/orotate phosphoribosyltransferase [Gloeocapsa sp. PCC 73106]|uniref:bifunctional orotidine-5'-phosphate decarboxylase/orotate phosphoribosyltransferase n=1 Tax=Gloeocapsa sp. PCC 73106 TaxID=102232 RepID=UPI0002ACE328|nr:bifunctional orotidine-5'-phosphate decarboxylase/orotate phosphoribosyltransferase [Gloeocapsa sp. PCC 73106]ELR98445.1 orotate phosphoribosyltransferase [Gloeocapsa sp. PCC 73106]
MSFFEKLNQAIALNQSLLLIGLDPNPEMIPPKYLKGGKISKAQLRDWLTEAIAQTSDLVCAYKPTLGFYQALGVEGIELLIEILQIIPKHIPVILDAKHGDLNSSSRFAETIFEDWAVDAVTISPYAGQDQAIPFLLYPDKGVFVLCCTSNPGASILQEYPQSAFPLYLQVVREAKNWGTPEQIFLEVGTTQTEIISKIRAIAPERTLLLRSFWQEAIHKSDILSTGLSAKGEGLILPIPQDWLSETNLREKVITLNQEVNEIRAATNNYCDLWTSNVCLLQQHPHQELILQLYDIGCLLFGDFVQASGATFSYYIDLRKIISQPQLFHQVLHAYAKIVEKLTFDRIAGIPYGALPTATGLALMLHHPMIFPRKEVKAHGTRRMIEGHYQPGEKVVVIDDILISGNSALEGAAKLQSCGLIIQDIVVFINHERGVTERLQDQGYQAYAVMTISEISNTLYAAGRITEKQYQCLTDKNDNYGY